MSYELRTYDPPFQNKKYYNFYKTFLLFLIFLRDSGDVKILDKIWNVGSSITFKMTCKLRPRGPPFWGENYFHTTKSLLDFYYFYVSLGTNDK